jgi:hypothetical protein
MRAWVQSRGLRLVCEKYTGWQGFRPDSYSSERLMTYAGMGEQEG